MNVTALVQTGRRLAADARLDVGRIYDQINVSDGRGGWTNTYVARSSTIQCRVVGVKDTLAENIADVLTGPATALILCEYGTVMQDGDRILINGVTYQIGARLSASSVTTVQERYVGREV